MTVDIGSIDGDVAAFFDVGSIQDSNVLASQEEQKIDSQPRALNVWGQRSDGMYMIVDPNSFLKRGFIAYEKAGKYSLESRDNPSVNKRYEHELRVAWGQFTTAIGYNPSILSKCKKEMAQVAFLLGIQEYEEVKRIYQSNNGHKNCQYYKVHARNYIAHTSWGLDFFTKAMELNPNLSYRCRNERADLYYYEAECVLYEIIEYKDKLFSNIGYRGSNHLHVLEGNYNYQLRDLCRKHFGLIDKSLEINPDLEMACLLKARINVVLNYNPFTLLLSIENYTKYLEKNPEDWEIYNERVKACQAFHSFPHSDSRYYGNLYVSKKLHQVLYENSDEKDQYKASYGIIESLDPKTISDRLFNKIAKDLVLSAQKGSWEAQDTLKKQGIDWRLIDLS